MFKYGAQAGRKLTGFLMKKGDIGNGGKAWETAWDAAVLPLKYTRIL
jgi:hypothetical protein